jgi:speckle-type POZ protein
MLLPGYQEFKLECSSARLLGLNAAIYSETLSAGGHTWRMASYPHGGHHNRAECISLYLELITRDEALGDITAIFDAFLINTEGLPATTRYSARQRCLHIYPAAPAPAKQRRRKGGAGLPHFADWPSLMNRYFQLDGIVTIIWGVIVVNRMQPTPIAVQTPSPDMANHLARLLNPASAVGTDVSFVVGGETFHAHRALLAARSPVFMAELFGPMLEARASSITLHDIDAGTFKAMLRFIYTDDLPTQQAAEDEEDDILYISSVPACRCGSVCPGPLEACMCPEAAGACNGKYSCRYVRPGRNIQLSRVKNQVPGLCCGS